MGKYAIAVLWLALSFSWASSGYASQKVLVLGDSLSAAYGIPTEYGWVSLLDAFLQQDGRSLQVVNASISGETTTGGRARLPALLEQYQPTIVILELGGNDGLQGQSLNAFRDNLGHMVRLSLASGAQTLLIGMHIPPNYGKRYTLAFHETYRDIAAEESIPLVPFLLEGIATQADMMQADGIHPTAAAQPTMLNNVLPYLKPMLVNVDQPAG